MRESFAEHGVIDFFSKEDFKTGKEFVETVRRAFAAYINLDLEILWEPASAAPAVC